MNKPLSYGERYVLDRTYGYGDTDYVKFEKDGVGVYSMPGDILIGGEYVARLKPMEYKKILNVLVVKVGANRSTSTYVYKIKDKETLSYKGCIYKLEP